MTTGGKKARERAARKAAIEAKKRRRRNLIIGGLALVVIGVVAFAVTRPEAPELAATEKFADLGGGHLQPGDPTPVYNSSPATSGPHNPSAAACGIYKEELPDVTLVHNLEHGTVVVQYQPDLPASDIAVLEAFARTKPSHILVAPRADLADPVVLATWTRLLGIDTADINTLDVFYDRWARIGPEVGVQCPFAIDQAAG